jgi:hypothetical protein
MTTEQIRAADAKGKAAFYGGASDRHPQGASGKRWVLPPETTSNTWDTSQNGWRFSEWGNASGAV